MMNYKKNSVLEKLSPVRYFITLCLLHTVYVLRLSHLKSVRGGYVGGGNVAEDLLGG